MSVLHETNFDLICSRLDIIRETVVRELSTQQTNSPVTVRGLLLEGKNCNASIFNSLADYLNKKWAEFYPGDGTVPFTADCLKKEFGDRLPLRLQQAQFGWVESQMELRNLVVRLLPEWSTECDLSGQRRVIIVDYTCHATLGWVKDLLRNGIRVSLYLQTLEGAARLGSQHQRDLIETSLKDLWGEPDSARWIAQERLKIVFYNHPPSLHGIWIEDASQNFTLLSLGWQSCLPWFRRLEAKDPTLRKKVHEIYQHITFPTGSEAADDLITFQSHCFPRVYAIRDYQHELGGLHFAPFARMFQLMTRALDLYYSADRQHPDFLAMDTLKQQCQEYLPTPE